MTYFGTSLDTIGNNMARTQMAGKENQRLAVAQLLQALMQREQQAQQQRQFSQEMQYRNTGQQQDNAYKQALLALERQKQDFSQTGYTPEQEWHHNYLMEELKQRPDLYRLQSGNMNGSALAALINQLGIGNRDSNLAQEAWEQEKAAAEAKAAEYNARAKAISDEASAALKNKSWYTRESTAQADAQSKRRIGFQTLMEALSQDKRPGIISPDATGTNFVPVLPKTAPSRGQVPVIPGLLQGGQGTNGMNPNVAVLLQALGGGTNAISAPVVDPAQAHQQEVLALQNMAKTGTIDRRTYMQKRLEIDAKYGVGRN